MFHIPKPLRTLLYCARCCLLFHSFTVVVPGKFESTLGHSLGKDQSFKFTTTLPQVVWSFPAEGATGIRTNLFLYLSLTKLVPIATPFFLKFNQPISSHIVKECKLLKAKKTFCDLVPITLDEAINEGGVSNWSLWFVYFSLAYEGSTLCWFAARR